MWTDNAWCLWCPLCFWPQPSWQCIPFGMNFMLHFGAAHAPPALLRSSTFRVTSPSHHLRPSLHLLNGICSTHIVIYHVSATPGPFPTLTAIFSRTKCKTTDRLGVHDKPAIAETTRCLRSWRRFHDTICFRHTPVSRPQTARQLSILLAAIECTAAPTRQRSYRGIRGATDRYVQLCKLNGHAWRWSTMGF